MLPVCPETGATVRVYTVHFFSDLPRSTPLNDGSAILGTFTNEKLQSPKTKLCKARDAEMDTVASAALNASPCPSITISTGNAVLYDPVCGETLSTVLAAKAIFIPIK
jgi:hypothetical protein